MKLNKIKKTPIKSDNYTNTVPKSSSYQLKCQIISQFHSTSDSFEMSKALKRCQINSGWMIFE